MSDPFKERMKRMRQQAGFTSQQAAADAIGCERGTVGMWEAPSSAVDSVSSEYLHAVSRAYRVRPEYINSGKGSDGFPWTPSSPDDSDWRDVRGYAQAVGLGNGVEAQEYEETHKLKFRRDSLARKRLFPDQLAVIYGKGDSMLPRIHSGDAILFDQSDTTPADGHLYVIATDGAGDMEYNVKRCEVIDDMVFFRADNPTGDHRWRKPRAMGSKRSPIRVVGRVRWIGSWED